MCIKQAGKEENMRISILSIGVFVSILFINSVFANTVVANRTHVNNANASMQNKMQATGTKVTTRTCAAWLDGQAHTDANCLLWQLANKTDTPVQRCQTNADCGNPEGNRCGILCVSGMCQPQNC